MLSRIPLSRKKTKDVYKEFETPIQVYTDRRGDIEVRILEDSAIQRRVLSSAEHFYKYQELTMLNLHTCIELTIMNMRSIKCLLRYITLVYG